MNGGSKAKPTVIGTYPALDCSDMRSSTALIQSEQLCSGEGRVKVSEKEGSSAYPWGSSFISGTSAQRASKRFSHEIFLPRHGNVYRTKKRKALSPSPYCSRHLIQLHLILLVHFCVL